MKYQDIINKTKLNTNFREVVFTNQYSQFVLMSLLPNEEIGLETHHDIDQILYFVEGSGLAKLNGEEIPFSTGDIINVSAGTEHNFINTGKSSVKLFTVYSPPEHADGTIHKTKAEAEADEHDHH